MEIAAAVLDALPVPAVFIDAETRLAHANPAATAILGSAVVGRNYAVSLRQPVLLDLVDATFRHGQVGAGEFVTAVASRDTTWRVTAAPVHLANGGMAVLLTFEDRTAMREAGQMRRDFVANVSHELRTPLTALIGFVETLKGAAKDDPEARARFLNTMEREANRMNRLVADLLSLSQVEAVERMRPTDPVNISETVASVVSALRPLTEEHGTDVELVGAETAHAVLGDADQLSQVFTNLCENAIKYSGGGVQVILSQLDRAAGIQGPTIEISVIDDGEGIDPLHIPRLTERFYRVDTHRSREMGGTGLGLAIVKHIVNRHRGRLRIESAPGQGSRFTVQLPAHI
ncbi:MAG: ATP-binding protein [Pseudomonadota bacterium]